jgi:tetratricopeptide (TPR) repeat protein
MIKSYICLLFLCFSIVTYGQQDDQVLIDSIKSASPENLDSLYYNLFVKYRVKNPSLAEEYASLSYDYAKPSHDHNYLIRSLNALGYLSKQKQNVEKAIEYYTEAIKIASEFGIEERLVFLYNNLGNIYTSTSQFDMAIDNYLKSLQYARRIENINEQAIALNNIGLINYKLRNFDEAIAYYLNALEIRKANDLYEDINTTYINLALCYNSIRMLLSMLTLVLAKPILTKTEM